LSVEEAGSKKKKKNFVFFREDGIPGNASGFVGFEQA
jgi:hypothetical protein